MTAVVPVTRKRKSAYYPSLSNPNDINKDADLSDLYSEFRLSDIQKLGLYAAIYGRQNMFITGSAGVGKSKLMDVIAKGFEKQNLYIRFVSTTGISSTLIPQGITFHSFLQLHVSDTNVDSMVSKIGNNLMVSNLLKELDCLVIDEISMFLPYFLDVLHEACVDARGNSEAFGGLQLVVLGDFAQLSPIKNKPETIKPGFANKYNTNSIPVPDEIVKYRANVENLTYAFEHPRWSAWFPVVIHLTEVFRQTDRHFVELLQRLRFGELISEDLDELRQKSEAGKNLMEHMAKLKKFRARANLRDKNNESGTRILKKPASDIGSMRTQISELIQGYHSTISSHMSVFEFEVHLRPVASKYIQIPEIIYMLSEFLCTDLNDSVVHMFSTNKEVDKCNEEYVEEMIDVVKGQYFNEYKSDIASQNLFNAAITETYHFTSQIHLPNSKNRVVFENWLNEQKRNCLAKPEIQLKLGVRVMLTTNLEQKCALINGSIGLLVAFDPNTTYPIVRFPILSPKYKGIDGNTFIYCKLIKEHERFFDICIPPYRYILRDQDFIQRFKDKHPNTQGPPAHLIPHVCYSQIPIRVCLGLSIHKSQGQSFDNLVIDAAHIWDKSQIYVALSRSKNWKTVLLRNFKPSCVKADPKVRAYYKTLEKDFQKWLDVLEQLKATKNSDAEIYCDLVRQLYLNRFDKSKNLQATLTSILLKKQKLENEK